MKRILTLIILFATLLGTVLSQNGGNYWQQFQGPPGGEGLVLTKTGSNKLYAQHKTRKRVLYRSSDLGANWEEITAVTRSTSINFSSFFVGAGGNLYHKTDKWYRSADEGLHWDSLPASTDILKLTESTAGTLICYRGDNKLYRSTNAGQTWSLALDNSIGGGGIDILTQTPSGGLLATLVSTINNKRVLFRSVNDGQTWLRNEYPSNYTLIYIAPNGTLFFRAGWMYRSTDGGQTVEAVALFSPGDDKIDFIPTGWLLGRMFLEHNSDIYFSDNGGFNWEVMPNNLASNANIQAVQSIGAMPDSSVFCTVNGALYKSTDRGQTWHFSSNGIRETGANFTKVYSDSVFLAATGTGLWMTENAGQDWSLKVESETAVGVAGFEKTTGGGTVMMNDNKLFYSVSGLDSFVNISPPQLATWSSFIINPFNDHLFIPRNPGYWRSPDLGQTWEKYQNISPGSMTFHPSGKILALSGSNLLTSTDQGQSWTSSSIPNTLGISGLWAKPDGSLLMAVRDSSAIHFLRSTDIGETWVPTGGKHLRSDYASLIIDANGFLYSSDFNQLYVSTNDGLNWQVLPDYADSNPFPQENIGIGNFRITQNQKLALLSYDRDNYLSSNPISEGAFIKGQVRRDADADCSTPDAQEPLKNMIIEARGENFTYQTSTDPSGHYVFFVDTGAYQVAAINVNTVWWNFCDSVQSSVLTELFSVDTVDFSAVALSECPLMTVNLGASTMRRCFDNRLYVQYCNRGTETADSAWVDVNIDPYLSFVDSPQAHTSLGPNRVRFFVGDVASGDCGGFSFTVHVSCDSTIIGQTHCLTAHGYPDTLCTQVPEWSGANIEAAVECQDTVVRFTLQNTGTATSKVLDYIIIEDDVVMLQGDNQYAPGQSLSLPVMADGHTYRVESEQEPGHPFSTRAIAFEEGCGGFVTLGFINQFSVNGITPSWHRLCRENTGSFDPNDKHGYPVGAGAEHRIRPGQPIEYLIRFQNTGTDTAFTVVVRDTLSAWLNPASVLPGASSHPYTWHLDANGAITFAFANILLPDSTTNLAGSQGFVTFSIEQQANVPLGTQIRNKAAIFFDFNAPVITNETLHTVGVDEVMSSTAEQTALRQAVEVSPNPARETAVFYAKKGSLQGHRLELLNAMGQPVLNKEMVGNTWRLDRDGLPAGAYGWRVTNTQGALVDSGVLVFQ